MMKVLLSQRTLQSLRNAPKEIQKKFAKQLNHLLKNIRHPSLRAKKYDETKGIWQARIDEKWRFYFRIEKNVYQLIDVMPHPK